MIYVGCESGLYRAPRRMCAGFLIGRMRPTSVFAGFLIRMMQKTILVCRCSEHNAAKKSNRCSYVFWLECYNKLYVFMRFLIIALQTNLVFHKEQAETHIKTQFVVHEPIPTKKHIRTKLWWNKTGFKHLMLINDLWRKGAQNNTNLAKGFECRRY